MEVKTPIFLTVWLRIKTVFQSNLCSGPFSEQMTQWRTVTEGVSVLKSIFEVWFQHLPVTIETADRCFKQV